MTRTPHGRLRLRDALGCQDLDELAATLAARNEQASWRAIAATIAQETGVVVTWSTLRKWSISSPDATPVKAHAGATDRGEL